MGRLDPSDCKFSEEAPFFLVRETLMGENIVMTYNMKMAKRPFLFLFCILGL